MILVDRPCAMGGPTAHPTRDAVVVIAGTLGMVPVLVSTVMYGKACPAPAPPSPRSERQAMLEVWESGIGD